MTHTPSDAAMRFIVKWSGALRLDPFGCQIIAKAIDTEFPASTEAIEAGAVAELVDAAREVQNELANGAVSMIAFDRLSAALSQLAEAQDA